MTAIADVKAALPDESETPELGAAGARATLHTSALPVIRIGLFLESTQVVLREIYNDSGGILTFGEKDHVVKAKPLAAQKSLPYFYKVEFETLGDLRFQSPAIDAVAWKDDVRPPFIVEPSLADASRLLSLAAVDSVWQKQSASFELMLESGAGRNLAPLHMPVDPTIVNNPDFGGGSLSA